MSKKKTIANNKLPHRQQKKVAEARTTIRLIKEGRFYKKDDWVSLVRIMSGANKEAKKRIALDIETYCKLYLNTLKIREDAWRSNTTFFSICFGLLSIFIGILGTLIPKDCLFLFVLAGIFVVLLVIIIVGFFKLKKTKRLVAFKQNILNIQWRYSDYFDDSDFLFPER